MQWKVSVERAKILPHDNADALVLIRLGNYQIVERKDVYQDGELLVFFPDKSVLPNNLIHEKYAKYLVGANKNRVKGIRIRGEFSLGVVLRQDELENLLGESFTHLFSEENIGKDISEILSVTEYTPYIPPQLSGQVSKPRGDFFDSVYYYHDCSHLSTFKDEVSSDDYVVVTEKIHGSQINVICKENNGEYQFFISSKGLFKRGLVLNESYSNSYWQAAKNVNVFERLINFSKRTGRKTIQAVGEIIPVQKGYTYGQDKLTALFFEVRGDGFDYGKVKEFEDIWSPILYVGNYNSELVKELSLGMETVSGRSLHIKEGVVVKFPYRTDNKHLKVINPAYKESGEEIS